MNNSNNLQKKFTIIYKNGLIRDYTNHQSFKRVFDKNKKSIHTYLINNNNRNEVR